jgi:hypothetical protein
MQYGTSVGIPQASNRAEPQPSARVRHRVRLRHFFPWMSVALAVAVLWGFAPSYFFRPFINPRGLSLLLHVHGFLNSCWMTLLIVQTMLVAKHRTDIHRRLGLAGVILAPAVVAVSFAVGAGAPMRSASWETLHGSVAKFAFLAMGHPGSPMIFGLLFTAAVWLRRQKEPHKRLMLLATLAIMDAPMTRLLQTFGWPLTMTPSGTFRGQGNFWTPLFSALTPLGLEHLNVLPFFIALVVYDIVKLRRLHAATLLGGAVLFSFQPFFALVSKLIASS